MFPRQKAKSQCGQRWPRLSLPSRLSSIQAFEAGVSAPDVDATLVRATGRLQVYDHEDFHAEQRVATAGSAREAMMPRQSQGDEKWPTKAEATSSM